MVNQSRKSVKQDDYWVSVLTGSCGLVSQVLTKAILWDPVAGESQSGIHVTLPGVFEGLLLQNDNRTMKTLTCGILGAGRIGKLHAENLLGSVAGMDLKAIADPFLDEEWARKRKIPVAVLDQRVLLDDPEIDAILICSPSQEHVPQVIQAAQAGKHVFCEKPIALNPEDIHRAIAAVKMHGVRMQVGFMRRFDPSFSSVRNAVVRGEVGDTHLIRVTSRDPEPPPLNYLRDSGGMFLDMSVHDFDMMRFLSGSEVSEVYARGAVRVDPQIGEVGDIDTGLITLEFENGTLGVVDNSRKASYGYDQRVEVFGSKGSVSAANELADTSRLMTATDVKTAKPHNFFTERYHAAYRLELEAFAEAVRTDTDPLVGGREGLFSVLIGLAAKESLEKNQPVKVNYPDA